MAADNRKSRKGNFSQEEVDVLVSMVMQNHEMLYGDFSKSFFYKDARQSIWLEVLHEVNKVSAEKRTLQEVKNKWKKCHNIIKNAENNVDFVREDDLGVTYLKKKQTVLPT